MAVTTQVILIFLLCFVSGIIQSAIGFGSIIVMMAVLPLFLPANVCVLTSQIAGSLICVWILRDLVRSVDWKKVWLPTLIASVFGIIGLQFVKGISDAVYLKVLGALLVLLSLWLLCFSARVRIRATPVNGAAAGLISGVMGAFFAVSAPALVLYYSASTEDKDNYTACLQFTLAVQGVVTILGRGAMGMWTAQAWLLAIPALVGLILGTIPGKKIYGKLNVKTFKLLIHIFIGLLGLYIFFSN